MNSVLLLEVDVQPLQILAFIVIIGGKDRHQQGEINVRKLFTLASLAIAMSLCSAIAAQSQEPAPAPDAQAIFAASCAVCHTGAQDARAPSLDALHQHTPESVIQALTGGVMRGQGAHLTGAERRALAEFVTGQKLAEKTRDPNI